MWPWGNAAAVARVADELGVALDDRRHERVAREQLRMVLTHTRLGTVIATAAALFVALNLPTTVAPGVIRAWLVVKLVVAVMRIALSVPAAAAQEADDVSGAARWRAITYALLALDGAVWGVAGWRLMQEPITTAAFAAAALALVTSAATFGLQVRLLATACYVVPILAPTALGLALIGGEAEWVGAGGVFIMLAMQLVTAHGAQARLAAGVLLRLQAQDLAAEREAALATARRESAAKTEFMGKLSHELRTPLHGILGLARLLHVDLRHDPSAARRVELIEASGTHLLALINDLLDVSRVQTGRFELRTDRFDLRREFDEVTEVFAVRARDKGLAFEAQALIEAPYWVQGDAARWRQVLHNLLGNAIKFTRAGRVAVSLAHGEVPGMVRVAVQDSGPGIDPAEQARIFQPFQQHAGAGNTPTEGAGLGLTIARELAQAMGGGVSVASRLGAGSLFVFLARLPQADARAPQPAGTPPSPEAHRLPRSVLLAEDDDVNALIAQAFLEAAGVHTERVRNGREAVGHALRETQRPDLVLMDCRMPEMDGFAATREIRAQEAALRLPRVPVVALTAASAQGDREQCLDAGMDDFLSKPYTREDFLALLQRWAGPSA